MASQLSCYPSTHPSANPGIRPASCLSIYRLSTYPSSTHHPSTTSQLLTTCLPILYVCLFIQHQARSPVHLCALSTFTHLSIHPSIHPSLHSFICPFIHPSIHLFTHSSIHQFTHPSIYPPICPSTYSSIYVSIHSSVYLYPSSYSLNSWTSRHVQFTH